MRRLQKLELRAPVMDFAGSAALEPEKRLLSCPMLKLQRSGRFSRSGFKGCWRWVRHKGMKAVIRHQHTPLFLPLRWTWTYTDLH